ncbi:MAG: sulfotransferase [Sphingomonas sp.]|nr:sulfotransferase [Sphingomonas sp.]
MTHARPHFLHVGPEKTGTSWLYDMLAQHPQVRLNPVKEVRYLWESSAFPTEGVVARFRGRDWHNQDYRDYLRERLRYYSAHPARAVGSRGRLAWDLKFLFGRRSDDWFASLFDCDAASVTGDFSPQVSHLPPWDILRLSRAFPVTKILLTLRDPVEWSWSFARMSMIQGRDLAGVSESEFENFFAEYATYYPGAGSLITWRQLFGERFKLLFFEDIIADPASVIADVCTFLGLSTDPIASFEGLSDRSNAGRDLDLPDRVRRRLVDLHQDQMRLLAELCGSRPREWLARYGLEQRTV